MTKVKKGQEICGTPSIDHCVNYRIPEEGEERERTTKFIQRNTVWKIENRKIIEKN